MLPSYGVFSRVPHERRTDVGVTDPMTRCSGFSSSTLPENKCYFYCHVSCLKRPMTLWWWLVEALPVHCFFTSFVGTGWTAIRYFGSASKNMKYTIHCPRWQADVPFSHSRESWKWIERAVSEGRLTKLGLIRLSVLRQLDELPGKHAATIAQDVSLELGVCIGTQELHYDGVACDVDTNFHVLTSHWGEEEKKQRKMRNWTPHWKMTPKAKCHKKKDCYGIRSDATSAGEIMCKICVYAQNVLKKTVIEQLWFQYRCLLSINKWLIRFLL